MNLHGVQVDCAAAPLDETFLPLERFCTAFLRTAHKPVAVAVEREDGLVSVFPTFVHGTDEMRDADAFYIERLVKCLLWIKGGFRVSICGDECAAQAVRAAYATGGPRQFDADFMAGIYGRPFTVEYLPLAQTPSARENPRPLGRHTDGCRIGLDVGGSNLKYAAMQDGETVFAGETRWKPLEHGDPAYHLGCVIDALQAAAAHLPRVDAVGISSAGIFVKKRARVASIFRSVPKPLFERQIGGLYLRAAQALGDVPAEVANDGDVAALAGAMELGENSVLGVSMGTSEAGGFVDAAGSVMGWLNELAFVPLDLQPNAAVDPWSGDAGCGVEYLAQDAALRLAQRAGITYSPSLAPAERIKELQHLLEDGHPCARLVFETIGCYLGHATALYARFYSLRNILLYGGMTRGEGGSILLGTANNVLADEYPSLGITLRLPSDNNRRGGQSVAAATLAPSRPAVG